MEYRSPGGLRIIRLDSEGKMTVGKRPRKRDYRGQRQGKGQVASESGRVGGVRKDVF